MTASARRRSRRGAAQFYSVGDGEGRRGSLAKPMKFSRGTRRVIMAWHATTKGVSRTCDIELSMAAVCLDIHVLHASTALPYDDALFFLGQIFPLPRKSDSPSTILLVQLSISRRLDLFFFFGRAKRRNVTKRILFLFFLSSFPPRGGAEWFVIRCIRECRKRFDSIFNRERLYGGVWMWWKFEE